jgi:dolichyl-phosphate beta-glucosyltransferase
MPSFAIIIPCYNEADRLPVNAFLEFGEKHPDVQFYFVNDGSKDETEKLVSQMQQSISTVQIINLTENKGKGEAVRQGLIAALQSDHDLIGYLDADLSTTLEEFYRLKNIASNENTDILIGSRIKKVDTEIHRSFARHLAGRAIATVIDRNLKLGVYDTQCGAKIFKPAVLPRIIDQPFHTRWFFDVEILMRIRKEHGQYKAMEVPLNSWHNVRNSKLSILSFPVVMKELIVLLNKY